MTLLEMDYQGLRAVISGGQDGVDRGALEAAHAMNVQTGGWAPNGWRTTRGSDHLLRDKFRLREHPSRDYPPRTDANVKEADGTLIIASSVGSPGTALTLRFIAERNKPHHIIRVSTERDIDIAAAINGAVEWLIANNISILNVAGNHIQPDYHCSITVRIMTGILQAMKERGLLQVKQEVE